MHEHHLPYLACPWCTAALVLGSSLADAQGRVDSGELRCEGCPGVYRIVHGVPRFAESENYARTFGFQWFRHARTQYDSYTGLKVSESRFFRETRWDRDLRGQLLLEVGSGAGRFTEIAAATGATVVSLEYSEAAEVNYEVNGGRPNVLIVQGDIYRMPFRPGAFDKIFCFGMLQHTPDPARAFAALLPMLREAGEVVIDVYRRTGVATLLHPKYYVRPVVRRLDPERLYRLTRRWVDLVWPLCGVIRRIPGIGRSISARLLAPDYSGLGLTGELLKEWAYLDAFDMLSPRYDWPQTIAAVRRWFEMAGLFDVEVGRGYNGIEGRGRTRANSVEEQAVPRYK